LGVHAVFKKSTFVKYTIAIQATMTAINTVFAMQNGCAAQSAATVTPVVELYTSEGCSSCPPADKWLSTLKSRDASKQGNAVVQAFHVGYWDYIGWVDRFATPAHTQRQRQIAAWNQQNGIYTPQMVLNGKDWRGWGRSGVFDMTTAMVKEMATSSISLQQIGVDQFEAVVSPAPSQTSATIAPTAWSAYWTVTEHGHSSKVKAGENNGETLLHDYVVRQYTPVGDYAAGSTQKLKLRSVAATPGHARQINLVVFDPKTGKTIQAVSANCPSSV
jgi:hypothetical protein